MKFIISLGGSIIIPDNKKLAILGTKVPSILREFFGIENCRTKVRGIKPTIFNKIDINFLKCRKFSTSFKLVAKGKSLLDCGKFLSMLKNHPDAVNGNNIPPIYDRWFLTNFKKIINKFSKKNKFIIICGGGKLARSLQEKARKIKGVSNIDLDWIGVYATRINALTLKKIFNVKEDIITNPIKKIGLNERILIAAGWKPGFSTDYDAVMLAKNINADMIINMTNVNYVYDKNPKLEGAKPIKEIRWKGLRKIVGNEWKPGLNMPFDPIAAKEAEKLGLNIVVIGKDLSNLKKVLEGKEFKGTLIR